MRSAFMALAGYGLSVSKRETLSRRVESSAGPGSWRIFFRAARGWRTRRRSTLNRLTPVEVELPDPPDKKARSRRVSFKYKLNKKKLRAVRRREGRYLPRSNLVETDPGRLWEFYLLLVEVEAAFKNLKGDMALRPIFHQRQDRIEAHIFLAFLAYCIHVTLRQRLRQRAPGLTVRQALDNLGALQMLDVHFPTTDGGELIFTRYTQPEKEQQLLLSQLGWRLPKQPPPRIIAKRAVEM